MRNKRINQRINKRINKRIHQVVNQSVNQSMNQSISKPINHWFQHSFIKKTLFSLSLLSLSWPVFAIQTINVTNNANISATMSDKDFNKIFVDGERIVNVMGTPNAYLLQTDTVLGQVYLKPLQTQDFTVNLTTEEGHAYQLSLHVNHESVNTLELKPPIVPDDKTHDNQTATPYEDTLIQLIRAMATGAFPDGYEVNGVRDKVSLPLGNVASVTLISRYQGVNLEGDIYLITNLTNQPLQLQPTQLYRDGTMAIALETQAIEPKGQTRLFMVKQGASHA